MAEDELEVADLERAEVHETEAHLALGTWHLAEAQRLPERPTAMEQARSVANAEGRGGRTSAAADYRAYAESRVPRFCAGPA